MYSIIILIAVIMLLVLTGLSTNLLHKTKPVKESKYLSFICSLTTFITIIGAWVFSVMLLIEITGPDKSADSKKTEQSKETTTNQGSILTSWIK